jgi:ceramide glucosyltransferase
MRELLHKRLRWMVVMRHMRPRGHLGLVFTQGLPWSLAAVAAHPTWGAAAAFLGTYFALRSAMMIVIGAGVLKQPVRWAEIALIPVWDGVAFLIWLASFTRKSLRWRGADYYIRDGRLVPIASERGAS